MSATTSTKKCPHCGQWSRWQQRAADRCEHCGQLLDPRRYAAEQACAAREAAPVSPVLLIEIKPDDNAFVKFFKYIIRGGQLAFAAIVSFFLWLAAVVAG